MDVRAYISHLHAHTHDMYRMIQLYHSHLEEEDEEDIGRLIDRHPPPYLNRHVHILCSSHASSSYCNDISIGIHVGSKLTSE